MPRIAFLTWTLIVSARLFVPAPVAAGTVMYLDDDFNEADWTLIVTESNGGASQTASQALSGGNPGAYRYMTHGLPSPSFISIVHVFNAIYDPAVSGPIDSIDYREDRIQLNPPHPNAAIGALGFVFQNGRYYYTSNIQFTNTSWQTVDLRGLTAGDFTSGSEHPDFTANGSPLQFGYMRGNTNTPGGFSISTTHGIDNWSVTLHTQDVSSVDDEPFAGSIPLRILGPNPFSRSTAIGVLTSLESPFSLAIYDLNGRLVRSLIEDGIEPGFKAMAWDGIDDRGQRVPYGMYFVRLVTSTGANSKKIVFVR